MRRQSTELASQGTRIRSRDESRGSTAKRSRLRRLAIESLEARTLMATNPISVVSSQATASSFFAGNSINDSNPSIAVDPLNANDLAATFTVRDTSSGTTQNYVRVTFSTDGGVTWNTAGGQPFQVVDPTSTTGALLQDTAEGIGFDRNHNFFVGVLETNGSNAGAVAVTKYNFSGASPFVANTSNYYNDAVYRWDQAITGASAQPTVLNFSMAVDANVSAYVDPTTGVAQGDPNSGAVYIAWTQNTPPPQGVTFWNPDTIQVIASSDGVTWPAYNFTGDNGNGTRLVSQGNFNGTPRFTAPAIAVTQGKANGNDGGNISVIWDDFASGNNANPPVDLLDYASLKYALNPGQGAFVLSPVVGGGGGNQIATTVVRGALAAPYPQSTPSSPLGIGPGAQIAIDGTLGSFSAHQGRIYVTFVDRSRATGNPADNTDIHLIHSDDGGQTWSGPTIVNDDFGPADGHTGDDGGIKRGRPQYEPAIAVDNSTGTLVMSWLDVRDDASLQRYADYLTTSIDGGASFSPQTFADQPNIVTDATTGSTFVAGAYSGNLSGGNPNAETSNAFGVHQGLAVSKGVIHPAWSTPGKNIDGNARLTIETARATIAAGPRIISGTSGAIGGTSLSSFTVAFDRPVSIASFSNPNQVTVQFLNAATDATTSSNPAAANFDPNLAIASITANNPQGAQNLEATAFTVHFANVQTGVGTYSYAVSGAAIQDLLRTAGPATIAFDASGTAAQSPTPPSPTLPITITDPAPSTSTTTSKIIVSGAVNGDFVANVSPDIFINYPDDSKLTVTLTSPDGVTVTLVAAGTATGANFTNTAFSDAAPQTIGQRTAPYSGLFKPAQPLSAFANGSINGAWTLTIVDSNNSGLSGALTNWSLNITPQTPTNITFGAPAPLPASITDAPPAASQTTSTIGISNVPPADVAQAVTVSNLTIDYPAAATPLTILLTAPGGKTATLATNVGVLNNATFTTNAFTGGAVNGVWTLTIIDTNTGGVVGHLDNWSLHINAGTLVSSTALTGNLMDQNANGVGGQVVDYYANPAPVNPTANPFTGPYDTATLPIVLGGPRVVSTFVPNGTADPTGSAHPGNNLALNKTVSSIDVTFNSPMLPASFTGARVLTMMGPTGPIAGPFGVAPDPQAGEDPAFPKTFKIIFPIQQLSGTYTLTLGAGILSQARLPVDNNQNAGVGLLFTNATGTIPSGPTTFASSPAAAITPGSVAAPSTVSTSITIPANFNGLIQDFSLALDISYPNDPDLTATLTTPIIDPVTQQPFTVLLFSGNGAASGSKANFTNTVFSDSGTTLIQNGAPPFFSSSAAQAFKPLQSLLVNGHLAGANEAGTYTLTITNAGNGTGTLNSWSITTTPETTTNTGLGEPVADQSTASFRIFTMDPTNPLSSDTWTAVGPASNNGGGNSGRVSAIAVDPSDPSGNTVYVSGASGGVWKTTDFLTTSGNGPTYTLLTGNSAGNALNIGSIAVFSRNNDPNQSVIVAGTGEGNTAQPGVQGSSTVGTAAGIGFLISYDGGRTWTLDDSLSNYDAGGNEIPEAKRGHEFIGTTTYKVLVDPNPAPGNQIIMYAALGGGQGGSGAAGGVYRSLDSGHTWQLMLAGYATDIVFDPNSGAISPSNPTGNLRTIYGALQGQGVFTSPNSGQTWLPMNGGAGDPLLLNIYQGFANPVPVNAPPLTPNGGGGRIVLAKPALTGNALLDAEFETWLYAAVVTPAGAFNGLFLTKDNGLNWTDVRLPNALPASGQAAQGLDPTNDISQANYNITGGQGNYDFALAVDPNDPNVVYIGGSADFGPTTMIRVDVTRLSDPYSVYASTETAGGQILKNTTSPVTIKDPLNLSLFGLDPLSNPFTNLYRNPVQVFANNSSVFIRDTGTMANDGSGAWWTPFDGFIAGTDVHTIVPMKDPVTGKTRLLVGYDQGVASGIDNNGSFLSSIGNQSLPFGVRNGNLQITQFYNGAAQPSALAAQIAGALFYGEAQDDGFPTSNANVLTNGNIGWTGSTGDGTDVATDATGSGTNYQSTWPCCNTIAPNDFFQVNHVGRTFGLLQSTSAPPGGSLPGTSDPQWPYGPSSNFAVNPISNQQMLIASRVGRLFFTEDQGVIWRELAEPSTFDSTTVPALAYGAPDPNGPGIKGALDNYMIIGTDGGHIYVTFNGGGNGGSGNAWINISNGLDGSSVQRIVTDPTRGTHDAYAITITGVFYNANTSAANTKWVNVTGDLFKQTVNPFGDANLVRQQLLNLGGLAVDWRYVIPFDPKDATKGTHPMLYVAGVGGVFRSTNNGTNWTVFPDLSLNTPVADGNLPAASVTDLDMVLGNVDPTTGHPDVSTGPNLLLATTYGTGSYGIRLAPIVFNDSTNKVTETQNGAGVLTFTGLSEQSAFGTAVAVTVVDISDPNNPIFLGGYNPADGLPKTSPTFNTKANQTDVLGKFGVSGSYPTAPANNPFLFDGLRTVAVFATDASGTKGNVVTFQITNNLPNPAAPVFVNASGPAAPLTDAVVTGGVVITALAPSPPSGPPVTTATPTFLVTLPGTGITATVTLIRIDSLGIPVNVSQAVITGSGTIQDPGAPVGTYTYEITYTVPINGQPTVSPVSAATVVKVVPAETLGLFFLDDSGTPGDGVTNVTRPRFVGTAVPNTTADPNLMVQLVVVTAPAGSGRSAGDILASGVDPNNGLYTLQPGTALTDGIYTLRVRAKDAAGNSISSAPLTLTISTAGPKITPTLALLPSSIVPPGNPNVTVVRRPTVTGVTDPGATVGIYGSLNGGPIMLLAIATASQFKNGGTPAGTFKAQLPSNLNDGTITLYAFAHNAAGNGNPTPGVLIVKITSAPGDYTGVGRAGLAVYSPGTGDYIFAHAGTGITTFLRGFGLPNVDIPIAGDFNGDGQTDPAIYRPTNGYWAIDANSQATGQFIIYVAPIVAPGPNVIPAPGEFDADGQMDPAVYSVNASGFGAFTILHNLVTSGSPQTTETIPWGVAGDMPVPADFDGAGAAQAAVFRPSTGAWYVRSSGKGASAGVTAAGRSEAPIFVTGPQAGDVPIVADFDGINRAEEAIFRPSTETFYIYNPITKATRTVVMPKLAGQGAGDVIIPASADYTGDGRADAAIFDQTLGTYEYINSTTGVPYVQPFFATNRDIPPNSPYPYRAAANTAAPAFRTAGALLAPPPASTGSTISLSGGSGSGSGSGAATAVLFDQTLGTYEYINSATGLPYSQPFFATNRDIPPNSPYPYRAAANTAAPAFRTAGTLLAPPPGSTGSTISLSGGSGSGSGAATAALVIGAPAPTGSTSTGKASTLPTGTISKVPPIVLTSSSTGSARPAQDAADSAIASLGKSYKGLFV